ncbi:unnamed protein product, partial [Symbiodinium pilosum]
FGGCDACSGVSCTPDGLIGLNTYDWKYLCIPALPCFGPTKSPPLLKPNAKLPLMLSLIMGLQHALAMLGGIITPPSLISGDACFAWQLDQELCDSRQYMISAALICSGLLSLVQILRWKLIGGYTLGTGLVSVMGTSFTFLPIAREVVVSEIQAGRSGMDAYGKFLGTCLAASLTEIFISFVPPRYLKKIFPPVVSGTCVILIGAGLSVAGLKYWGGGVFCAENDMSRAAAFGAPQACTGNGDVALAYGDVHYFGLGLSVMLFLVFIQAVGSPFMKNCSVALALFFGFFVAGVSSYTSESGQSLAYVNSNKIDAAGAFTFLWTTTFNIGFYPPAFIPLVLGFVISAVETVGDIQGPDADSRIQGGLLADGLNSFLACLMTCNSEARTAMVWKFGAAIASIPDAVLGGMTTFLFANVLVSGVNIVGGGSGSMGRRTRFILAVSLGVGVGVAALPNWAAWLLQYKFLVAVSLFVFEYPRRKIESCMSVTLAIPLAEGGGLAGFHGGNLKHNIGLWPAKDVCKVFPTETYEAEAAKCQVSTYTASSVSEVDCTGMGGTYTAPVTATRTVTTCIGTNGNCCVEYDDSKKMWRDSLIIILKTPYCIGTLLALFLHLLLPFETEEEEGENLQKLPIGEVNL